MAAPAILVYAFTVIICMTQLNASAKAADSKQVEAILTKTRAELARILDDEHQNARTAHDIEIVFGARLSRLIDSSSQELYALGPSINSRLISYMSAAPSNDLATYYCAIACSNAVAKFGDVGFQATLDALNLHPAQKELFLNTLLMNFPRSFNYVADKASKIGRSDSKAKAPYVDALVEMLPHVNGQFWENGVSSVVEQARQSYGNNAPVEPIIYFAEPVFRQFSPQAKSVAADLIRLPVEIEPELLSKLSRVTPQDKRSAAISALGFIYPPDPKLLPRLETILQTPAAFDEHPAAAESLGRIIFRSLAPTHKTLDTKRAITVIAQADLLKAETSLRGVTNGHFSCMPAWYAICKLAASEPKADKLVVECIENTANVSPSLRRLTVELMRLNGQPSPQVVLPALMKVANAAPPREMDLKGLGQSEAKQDAAALLNKLKVDYGAELSRLGMNLSSAAPVRGVQKHLPKLASTEEKLAYFKKELQTQDAEKFDNALYEIGHLGKAAGQLVPDILTAYKARNLGDSSEARTVQMCLEKLGPDAAPAIPWLITTLDSQYGAVSWGAISTLGAIGPAAAPEGGKALRAFVMKNPSAMKIANEAFPAMGLALMKKEDLGDAAWKPEKALSYLEHAPSADYVSETFSYLIKLGPKAAYAVPNLIAYGKQTKVNDKYWSTRMELAMIFERIGPAASPAIPLLESWLQDKNVSHSAARAIRAIKEGK